MSRAYWLIQAKSGEESNLFKKIKELEGSMDSRVKIEALSRVSGRYDLITQLAGNLSDITDFVIEQKSKYKNLAYSETLPVLEE